MIYFVSNNNELFKSNLYERMTLEESIRELKSWTLFQFDTETTGLDPHIDTILLAQFGSDKHNMRIVVDCTSIDLLEYKDILESKFLVGQNLKFDLKFLYSKGIVPTRVYDTMIVEQLLYLGYPAGIISYSLANIAKRYLKIDIDKSIRGQIIWRGIDDEVIIYAANDVVYLEQIMWKQMKKARYQGMEKGAELECSFVPAIAYLEWCGIKLDIKKWQYKMDREQRFLSKRLELLNEHCLKYFEKHPEFFYNDLFDGLSTNVNWASPKQVITFVQALGYKTKIEDKKKGGYKDSVEEKTLKPQKGIDDRFLKLYFLYKEMDKVCSTYGQRYYDAINPLTGRIHTQFRQLGTASGRMACGSKQYNYSLAKLKGIQPKDCIYPQLQNLPADSITRSSFIPDKGNLMASADYSALESRLGADIYQDEAMIEEYLYGSGDIHSLVAKACFPEELEGIPIKDIKKKRPDLRQKAKAPEFAKQFGGGYLSIASSLGITEEEAKMIEDAFDNAFKGIATFAKEGYKKVLDKGYVLINAITGHKMYWWDWKQWKKRNKSFDSEFWDNYRELKESLTEEEFNKTKEKKLVSYHYKASSKWGRMALNAPTQGSGIIILKDAITKFFIWIIKNNLFSIVRLCNLVHDEAVIEYPKEMPEISDKLSFFMEESAAIYCKSLPIPAEAEVGNYWIH